MPAKGPSQRPRNGPREEKLDELPGSADRKFWKGDTQIIRLAEDKKCKHVFERLTGVEVRCKKCHTGYRLMSPDYELKDGHILYKSKKIL